VPRTPPLRPLPGSGSASLQCPFIQQLLGCFALIIGEGHATFRAALIGGCGWAIGGAWRSACLNSRGGPVVLGWIPGDGVPGQHLARNGLHAGFVGDFIQLLDGIPVQEVKQYSGIDHGIVSLRSRRHSEEARQVGDHQLGHAWILPQSNASVAGPKCVMQCPSAPGASADAFHGRHCHGLHALPITELGEHVGLELGDEGLEVGYHPLGHRPFTYAAHENKIVSEPFQKEQSSNMQCQRPKHRIAGASTLLIRPAYPQISTDKADRSNKLQVILRINAVDSENRPALPPIIASVELTKHSWNVLQQFE
jgi:hypothetical protein